MYKKTFQGVATLAACALTLQAHANGFSLNEQSASGAGTAFAGRASTVLDSSVIYGNPAGLVKLERAEVSGGFGVIKPIMDISHGSRTAAGTNDGDSAPVAAVPFGFVSSPISEDLSVGIGLYAPFGLVNDYESSFQGRYHGSYSEVKVATLQPTISYRINNFISLGGGLTINRIQGTLRNDLATAALNPTGRETEIQIKGDDIAYGYNLGVMVDLNEDTTWGLTYHSKVRYTLEGHTTVSDSPAAFGLDGRYKTQMEVTLPESVDSSVTYRFDERWTGYLGATWTRWSRMKELLAENSGVPALGQSLGFGTIGEEMSWHDTLAIAIGASYQLNPQWVLRTGFAYDPSPTTNEHRSVRIPVGNRHTVTLGAGYSPSDDIAFDVAYAYLWENTAYIHQENESGLQPEYSSKYDNSAHGLTAQLTYRF
ncbi:TPA: outer membrane protein transport protein [Pseudomonas aeruginosa]|nr:outer membrane protein transport protein [Pseudomonas aeruginosa]HEJ5778126.1 outer membrane protein transport protein [Pseudomonas aeruginosa]